MPGSDCNDAAERKALPIRQTEQYDPELSEAEEGRPSEELENQGFRSAKRLLGGERTAKGDTDNYSERGAEKNRFSSRPS
jgi:hypothetical protein